uniref:(California timema) hypothetical protein n=1 Tax=Timema californicum TaxID=61474 RepID=A0A7R9JES2_TIMCA|nr:unnamed protein product [Timema californicum]
MRGARSPVGRLPRWRKGGCSTPLELFPTGDEIRFGRISSGVGYWGRNRPGMTNIAEQHMFNRNTALETSMY